MAKTEEQKAAEKAAKEQKKRIEALTDGLKEVGVALMGDETPEQIEALAEQHGVKVLSPEEVKAAKKAVERTVSGDSAAVVNKQGAVVRTYTLADHGEDFADLAEEYAKKIGGSVR